MHENWSISDAREAFVTKKASAKELTQDALARAKKHADLNTFITLDEAGALRAAEAIDAAGASGVLAGVPVAVKDLVMMEGTRTTAGSKILSEHVAAYDATVVRKLRAAGAVIIGKLNLDEFAMGSSNENSAFGPVRNPWDKTRTAGGSSGGSAAAVARRIVPGSLGTDTGGSIREPAAFSGIVGVKPTYGRVSRYGVIAFASSLDQVGPFATTVTDAARMLEAIMGHDPHDSTSAAQPAPTFELESGVKGLRIGLPKEYFADGITADVRKAIEAAVDVYKQLGATIVDVSLPHTKYAISAYYLICTAEASSNLARYDGVRYGLSKGREHGLASMYDQTRGQGFGAEVKRRILLGTYALSSGYYDAYYVQAQKVRTLLVQDFAKAFEQCDALLTPTTPFTAFKLGEKVADPLQMYLADVFTVSCNMAGLPGLSLPCGFDSQGLPIGLQLLGRAFDEQTLLRIARAYERETAWHQRTPPGF
jgi:aspartyl-tRNA(Asn)/glutamyl-tRNA(Gln) amidotransferase subunit A